MCLPMVVMFASAVGVSYTICPSNITHSRSDTSRSSSRSELTSSTAAPALRLSMILARMSAVAMKSRPKQGFAVISTSQASASSRAKTARWTLPPDRLRIGDVGDGVLTENISIRRSALFFTAARETKALARAIGGTSKRYWGIGGGQSGRRQPVRRTGERRQRGCCGSGLLHSGVRLVPPLQHLHPFKQREPQHRALRADLGCQRIDPIAQIGRDANTHRLVGQPCLARLLGHSHHVLSH